jgi:hypothetical protein
MRSVRSSEMSSRRRRLPGLLAAFVMAALAGCTPSPPSAVKATPTVTASPASTLAASTLLPAEASPTPSAIPSPTVYPRLPIPAGTPRCHTAQLEVAFVMVGAAAGNVEATFEMRNKSAAPCWIYGFVGFQTLDRNGRPIPRTLVWTTESFFGRSQPASRILLAADAAKFGSEPRTGYAFFNLAGNDVLCDTNQTPVVGLEIWPPDERQPLFVPARSQDGVGFLFCGGIELNPLQVQPLPNLG